MIRNKRHALIIVGTSCKLAPAGGNYNIEQVNIGLGKGKALETFNENIINFEIIK